MNNYDLRTCSLQDVRQVRPDIAHFLSGSRPTGKAAGVELFDGCRNIRPEEDWLASEALRKAWTARCGGDEHLARRTFMQFARDSQAIGEPISEKF